MLGHQCHSAAVILFSLSLLASAILFADTPKFDTVLYGASYYHEYMPYEVRFQFSARDMVSRFDGLRAYKRQTSTAGAEFLHHLKMKFPFRIKAIQIDGGSEFMDQFEEACRRAKILLFLNPPHHPELNGGVERSNRTHREEFYEVEDVSLDVGEHNKQLAKYEYRHNYIRPHRGLDMETPYEYYLQWKRTQRAQVSRMY
jgi:transposase InsO family protein